MDQVGMRSVFPSMDGSNIYYPIGPAIAVQSGEVGVTNLFYPPGNPKRHGALGDGIINDTTAMNNCRLSCVALGIAMEPTTGTYLLTAGVINFFNANGFTLRGRGNVTFKYTGAGVAFECAAALGGYAPRLFIENLLIEGNSATTVGARFGGLVHGSYARNIEVKKVSNAGTAFYVGGSVYATFENLVHNIAGEAANEKPDRLLHITEHGAGFTTTATTFINFTGEGGLNLGIYIENGHGCTFIGGGCESMLTGVVLDVNALHNHFTGFWCEDNATKDIEDAGKLNNFVDCHFASSAPAQKNFVASTTNGALIMGGYIAQMDLQGSARNVLMIGVSFDNATAITFGVGATYQMWGCLLVSGALLPTSTYKSVQQAVQALVDVANIVTDCFVGNYFKVTLAGNRTMSAPVNPANGQRIQYTIVQDGVGGRTLAWNAVFKVTWSDAGNLLNKRSTIAFVYDGTNWNQDGAQTPYV